ncbi:acyl-CoA dehydrogenase [Croceicoccus naphthovorans]|uniref:Acyl-CoA dehydrogenase n=2 Tax=Croceicoccus naphthovorans TaxID=1348774 RepID=A0A0G3XLQ2_9SPHN|nr:acyl-CoA dehydrogenase [Croceicoccus naphthovorans]AKM11544.1 acyl-CoA dehydrogenase [Croceicoccus naphthovorans]
MNDILIDRDELDFLLWDWLGLQDVLDRSGSEVDREAADAILAMSHKLARDSFLPLFKLTDANEPVLEAGEVRALPQIGEALREYASLGLFAAGFSEDHGGLGMPTLLSSGSLLQFFAASLAVSAYPMLTVANARLLTTFGSAAQIETFAMPQIAGEWFGTMCLSEPQAGSNLADVATRAMPDGEDGLGARYRLFGNKMWISGGDHDLAGNIVHLVLAKIPGDDGQVGADTRGISLFVVPKFLPDGARNDIVVTGLNHKLGYRGTTNCVLAIGESGSPVAGGDGALGWLVGEPGQGLPQMFQMMNEARLNVGMGAAAAGYRSYRHASIYARERLQGSPIGAVAKTSGPIIRHPDVRDMLMAAKCYGEGALALVLYCARLVDTAKHDPADDALLSLLTPVAKTWPSEWGLAANDIAIQIHGGYGYTRDFDVEQLWRDNRLNPIHEGTTGIQAQDLVGRKIRKDKAGAFDRLGDLIAATVAASVDTAMAAQGAQLGETWDRIAAAVAQLRECDAAAANENATGFLRAFGHVVVAWQWLDRALLCVDAAAEDRVRAAKPWACRYFFERELPRIGAWLGPIEGESRLLSQMNEDYL